MSASPASHGGARIGLLSRRVVLLLAWSLSGCASHVGLPLEPKLFPALGSQPATREATRVVISLTDPAQTYTNPSMGMRAVTVHLPIGAIVEAAAQLAMREQFEAVAAAPSTEPGMRVQISNVVPDIKSWLVFMIPTTIGIIDRIDQTSRLSFSLAVLGPGGSPRWSRDYDTGVETPQPKPRVPYTMDHLETLQQRLQRTQHEQAVRLMRLAAQDLRAWWVQEGGRERSL